MRKEEFFEVLGELDDKLVKEAKAPMKKKMNWKVWGAMAACLCFAWIGGLLYNTLRPIAFNTMIANHNTDTTVHYTNIDIADKVACYHEVSIDSSRLGRYVGEQYAATEDGIWYTPAETTNLKYLIRQESGGSYSLWVFSDFVISGEASYTYGDVLKIIYGVNSAEDMIRITAAPSNSNNTDLGSAIQKEIGTKEYTDRESIETFYNIISNVICYGANSTSKDDDTRFTYSFSTDHKDKLASGESTYGTRFIQVVLADGTTIDSWKYNALSGCFFEYGGIFTEPLSDEDVYRLNGIFDIK